MRADPATCREKRHLLNGVLALWRYACATGNVAAKEALEDLALDLHSKISSKWHAWRSQGVIKKMMPQASGRGSGRPWRIHK